MRSISFIQPLALPLALFLAPALGACTQQKNEQVEQKTEEVAQQVERTAEKAREELKTSGQKALERGEQAARVVDDELVDALDKLDDALKQGDKTDFEKQADRALDQLHTWIQQRRSQVKDSSQLAAVLDQADAEVAKLRTDLDELSKAVEEGWHKAAQALQRALRDLSQNMNAALEQ